MFDQHKIRHRKAKLKASYQYLVELEQDLGADCGVQLLSYISPRFRNAAKAVFDDFTSLQEVDPECPSIPSWIKSAAGIVEKEVG